MALKNELEKKEAAEFKENNGIVLRTIFTLWKSKYFTWNELLDTLAAYKITSDDVLSAMYYLNDKNLISCKHNVLGEIGLWDVEDYDDVKFRIRGDGYNVALAIIQDESIDL